MPDESRDLVILDTDDDMSWDDDDLTTLLAPEETTDLGWYRCVVTDTNFKQGTVVYVTQRLRAEDGFAADEVMVRRGDKSWRYPEDTFEQHFEFDPQGQLHRQQEIADLLLALDDMGRESKRMTAALRSGESQAYIPDGDPSTALVTGGNSAESAKRMVAGVRNSATKMKLRMEAGRAEIEGLMREQTSALHTQIEKLQEMVTQAEKAVWVLNLYLGVDEQVVQIREGKPADKMEPIAIRQRRLYMDEECAIDAGKGGIDFESLDAFDNWLLASPARLDQVLPDIKGIVALRPRRREKDRRELDPWTQAQKAKEDRRTYFLMRNGEQLYRFWTSYEAGERLMPREDEFLGYFRDGRGNPIKAGSEEWMKAQKASADDQMHYRMFFLLLQGLLDRTTIFAPLPGPVQLGDPNTWETVFHIIRDDEKALAEGRERFTDWLKRINSKLDVGMRVVGAWRSYESGLAGHYEKQYGNTRIRPRGAELPHDDEIYRVEGKRDGGYFFYYKRQEENWRAKYSSPYSDADGEFKKRASCIIQSRDSFVLNIDSPDIRVDDMRYYLTSRLDRAEYNHMFPTLKVAIAALEAEAAEEAPFRQLLIGQMARSARPATVSAGADYAEAEAAVDDLIRWYKTANRWHRALAADDAKAIRLIVAEYNRRQRLAGSQIAALRDETLVKLVREAVTDALLIAQKTDGSYVVLAPENSENVYVAEMKVTESRYLLDLSGGGRGWDHWRVVGARWQSWRGLYQAPRWKNWNKNASPWEHLTDPERVELARAGWAREVERMDQANLKRDQGDSSWRGSVKQPRYTPLLLAATASGANLRVWFRPYEITPPPTLLDHITEPRVHSRTLTWKRDAHRKAQLVPGSSWDSSREHPYMERSSKWWHSGNDEEHNVTGWPWQNHDGSADHQVLWIEDANLEIARQDKAKYWEYQKPGNAFRSRVSALASTVAGAYVKRQEEAAFAKFLADFNDLELWEGHKKALKIQSQHPYGIGQGYGGGGKLYKLIVGLLLADVDPAGMTLAEADARLKEIGPIPALEPDQDDRFHRSWKTQDTTPTPDIADLVIGEPPKANEPAEKEKE